MSNIFYNIEPKVINTELACLIGLNEAIVLQQLHYWLEKNKATATNFKDGRYWTYGTSQEYRDRDFPFWSLNTFKRTITRLMELGFVEKGNYNRLHWDKTNWYSINYGVLEKWLSDNEPIERPKMGQSNDPNWLTPLTQNEPMEQPILSQSSDPNSIPPSTHFEPMEQPNLGGAIQENKKQINNKRLTNKTNTQKTQPPTACVNVSTENAVVGEIVEPVEMLFDEFWKLYPRKESKQQAKKAWLKLKPDQSLFNLIANALEYRNQTQDWLAENGRYIPHPATWLNGRRWEDEQNPTNISQSAVMEQKYGDLRIDGKLLDPVQKKQLEYLEKQMRERQDFGEV